MILFCCKMLVKSRREIAVRYYKKWRNKLRIENNVRRFVEIMERKTRNAIKNIFINGLIRKNGESQVNLIKTQIKISNDELNK